MIRICPSILNANFDDLPNEIGRIAAVSDLLHLDVMDGKFVPNFTFSPDRAREIIEFASLPVDVHLMIEAADVNVLPYLESKAASVTVHYEACASVGRTLAAIRASGKRAALAIKPGTPFSEVMDYLGEIDMLLVMTVEPGFGGQKFMSEMMPKVRAARQWLSSNGLSDTWIQVDGGINEETIRQARQAGADTFVAGSVVFRADDPAGMVETLRHNAETNL